MARFYRRAPEMQHRFRSASRSSVRGKISAPIIHPDDEFPMRNPGTGIATPVLEDIVSGHVQGHESTDDAVLDGERYESISPDIPEERFSPLPGRQTPLSDTLLLRESMTAETDPEKPLRQKSTLKKVFGRFFGSSRKAVDASPTRRGPLHASHASESTALSRPPDRLKSKRSNSMPINELSRALGSHSPFPKQLESRPRGATTNIYTQRGWTGLSPPPVARDSARDSTIGCALSSNPHRRSRSVGHLAHTPKSSMEVRRRSDEIKYWRESYVVEATSPLTLKPETIPDEPVPEVVLPQPFNFGMGEMAGMKITQAASLESRVTKMEHKLVKMEEDVLRLHSRGLHAEEFGATSNLGSSVTLATESPDVSKTRSETSRRPSTATVVAPAKHISALNGVPPALNLEHYNTLMALIQSEQDARRLLEEQVRILQNELYRSRQPSSASRYEPHASPLARREFSTFDQSDSDSESDFDGGRYGRITGVDVPASYGHYPSYISSESDEVFRTPREDSKRCYDAYLEAAAAKEELDGLAVTGAPLFAADDDANERLIPPEAPTTRTMSLSQLTLGRGLRAMARAN